MKKSLLLTLTSIIVLLLAVSPVMAQLSEFRDYDFDECTSGKSRLSSGEFVQAFGACSATHLAKLSAYPDLSNKFKEIVDLQKAIEVHDRDFKEKLDECRDVCNDDYWDCVRAGEFKNLDQCKSQFLYDDGNGLCNKECRMKFGTSKYGKDHSPANVKETIRLNDAYWAARSEYTSLTISGGKTTKLVPKELNELEAVEPEKKKASIGVRIKKWFRLKFTQWFVPKSDGGIAQTVRG